MEKVTLTREELYKKVWKKPLIQLAKEFNISDVGLRKVCLKFNIPLPKSGHWSKIKHGKKVKPLKLPFWNQKELKPEISFSAEERKIDNGKLLIKKKIAELEKSTLNFKLAKDFRKAHPVVRRTKSKLEARSLYDFERNNDRGRETLHIDTSKELRSRALLFMDRLLKIVEERGGRVWFENGYRSLLEIDGQSMYFMIKEKDSASFKENGYGWRERTLTPTGKLYFKVEYNFKEKMWLDGSLLIENRFPEIIATLDVIAIKMREYQKELEKGWEEQRIRREEEQHQKELQEAEHQKTQELFKNFESWKKAKEMLEYISELEENGNNPDSIEWARKKVAALLQRDNNLLEYNC